MPETGRCFSFGDGCAQVLGPLSEVRRAVALHPRAGRLALPGQSGLRSFFCCSGEGAPRSVHDVAEDRGQIFWRCKGDIRVMTLRTGSRQTRRK